MIFVVAGLFLLILLLFVQYNYLKSPKSLHDDVIVITGCGSGIGRHLCLNLSKYCVNIVGIDVNEEALKETQDKVQEESGISMKTYVCDVS